MYAGHVEAVPAVASTARAEHLPIPLARVVGGVVLARHREHVRRVQLTQHLLDLIELLRCGEVSQIAGVDDEVRRVAEVVDLTDGVCERLCHIGIRWSVESDVTVTDLGEPQNGPCLLCRVGRPGDMRDHFPARDGQYHCCTEPGAVPDQLASTHPRGIVLGAHWVTTTVPTMNGWIEQM
jgi:hypothetical protein